MFRLPTINDLMMLKLNLNLPLVKVYSSIDIVDYKIQSGLYQSLCLFFFFLYLSFFVFVVNLSCDTVLSSFASFFFFYRRNVG